MSYVRFAKINGRIVPIKSNEGGSQTAQHAKAGAVGAAVGAAFGAGGIKKSGKFVTNSLYKFNSLTQSVKKVSKLESIKINKLGAKHVAKTAAIGLGVGLAASFGAALIKKNTNKTGM